MPYVRRRFVRRRRSGFRGRKRSYRRAFGRSRRTRGRRIPFLYPKTRMVKLVYDDVWYLNSDAATFKLNTFRLNSVFDPDVTGIGGTPSGLVEWGNLFHRYKVYGCKVQTKWVANCNQCLLVGFHAYSENAGNYVVPGTSTQVQQCLTEMPNSVHAMIGPANVGAANATCKLSRYFSMKSILGPHVFADEASSADVTANPGNEVRLDVMLCDALTATANDVAFVNVRLTFYVKFSMPDATYVD